MYTVLWMVEQTDDTGSREKLSPALRAFTTMSLPIFLPQCDQQRKVARTVCDVLEARYHDSNSGRLYAYTLSINPTSRRARGTAGRQR